jgi:hypothetical protein
MFERILENVEGDRPGKISELAKMRGECKLWEHFKSQLTDSIITRAKKKKKEQQNIFY